MGENLPRLRQDRRAGENVDGMAPNGKESVIIRETGYASGIQPNGKRNKNQLEMKNGAYKAFLANKTQLSGRFGFKPTFLPDCAFDFQKALIEWAVEKGRSAIFADCGLGKTLIQLAWAQNVVEKTNGRVLIITPLAVGHQTVREGEKFGISAARSPDGAFPLTGEKIIVTNYERLHYFNPNDFEGVVCDESSILKNFDGATRAAITEFMRTRKYRLLCTATAAPNDYIELGTSSEAIGELGFSDMISRFFKKEGSTTSRSDEHRAGVWRFRGHAERDFWRWICSWARAIHKPSDMGFDDGKFELPPLETRQHVVTCETPHEEFLFTLPANGLAEQRSERRRTINERCELAANIHNGSTESSIAWCHLNSEGDLLAKLIPDSEQVSGDDSDERKEEVFTAFQDGKIRVLVSKATIAGFGLNFQHCARQTMFPSHSFEQYYQSIRRSWRFGQKKKVVIDIISSEGEASVLANLQRKADAAEKMFAQIVELMGRELNISTVNLHTKKQKVPAWL